MTVKKSKLDIEFTKIGRATDATYYAYYPKQNAKGLGKLQSLIVVDQHGFVFEKSRTKDWHSIGPNGYRIFKEEMGKGTLIEIDQEKAS